MSSRLFFACILLAWTALAVAQDAYPSRPIKLIVSFTPGGGADLTARTVGQGMATSSVANNKIKVYELNGKRLPAGWVLDGQGRPITEPAEALEVVYSKKKGGGQTPLGGTAEMSSHKGYGLALMVHILGGTLSGASFSPIRVRTQKPSDPDRLGHFFLAVDPKAFRPDGAFEEDLDAVIDVLHGTAPVDPAQPVLVPGDPEAAARERRLREGIPLPASLLEKLRAICERSGVAFIL